MNEATISLMPINDLLAKTFFVPAYQRGYRWTERQVEDLLKDIWEFQQEEHEDKQSFYCLQPLVVQGRPGGDWEVVDGQQRLMTIFLILTYLKQILDILGKSRFTIAFETRSDTCGAFLQNIDLSQREANIDYYHICRAYDFIRTWFEGRDGNHRLRFLQCLLNDDEIGRNVKVIWYNLPEAEDPVAAFTRLNVGKIPLTNAELIRALFLRANNFDPGTKTLQQLKIAQEWDGIEKALQEDDLWYFLHPGPTTLSSRIDYIFQLIAREEKGQAALSEDPYRTFHFYHERFGTPTADAEKEWLAVKQNFMTLEEWFDDRVLYHLIGYLICDGDDLLAIRKAGKGVAKSEFHRILKRRIFKRLIGAELPPGAGRKDVKTAIETVVYELEYGPGSAKLRSFLLLFNIATLLQNPASNLRFPFDSFKKEIWDIEHVRSVTNRKPERTTDRKDWLERVHEYLSESGDNGHIARAGSHPAHVRQPRWGGI